MARGFQDISIRRAIFLTTMAIIVVSLAISNVIVSSRFSQTHRALIEEASQEVNQQIVLNFENYMGTVIDSAHLLRLETFYKTKEGDLEGLLEIYEYAVEIDRNVTGIMLVNLSGNPLLSTFDSENIRSGLDRQPFFLNALKDDTIFHFTDPQIPNHLSHSDNKVITVSRVMDYYDLGERKEAVLMLDLSIQPFLDLAEYINLGEAGHILLTDADNALIFDPMNKCEAGCESLNSIANVFLGGAIVSLTDAELYVHVNTLEFTRWKLVTFADIGIVNQTLQTNLITFSLIFVSAVLLTGFMTAYTSKRISNPLDQLKEKMVAFNSQSFVPVPLEKGQKEVRMLSSAFNDMAAEIKHLVDRVYEEQRAKRKTQFQALQNQINPHFLYNTLESILYLSEENKGEDVQAMVTALSKFFRLSISNESGEVRWAEELAHAENYLVIQKIRYRDKFTYTLESSPTLADYSVLKLSLQPLLENAIHHGVDQMDTPGHISVKTTERDGYLWVEVSNTGYGLSQEKIANLYTSMKTIDDASHIGLRNIYRRIQLQFGPEADVIITSVIDQTTTVTLKYPLKVGKHVWKNYSFSSF